jgi:PAS domain S-box-containing protein
MKDEKQTKAQLLAELAVLRQRVASLETEVAERKRVESELRDSQDRYRALSENATDIIATLTLDQIITNVNRGAEVLLGWSREELIGQHVHKVATPASVALAEDRIRRFLARERISPTFEVELIRKDGSLVPAEAWTRGIRDPQGKISAFHGIYRDISARKKAEAQLKEEAEIAAALARVGHELISSLNTPEILARLCRLTTEVLECDCSHTVLWQPEDNSYVAAAGYGDTPEQWEALRVLKVPSEMVTELETQLTREGMSEVEITTPQRSAIEALLRQFGITTELYVALRHGQHFIGAQSAGYRGRQGFSARQKRIAQGIAQLASLALANARLLEELTRSNQLKEDFVGTMSHELRTPINILLGYNEMLRDGTYGSLTPAQVNILERMDKNVRELLDLVNATLDLSRLQSRRVPLTRQDVWVSKFLMELEAEIHQLNRKPALQLEWQVAADLPIVRTDLVKLRMILKNIILNALKFTEEGTVTISAFPQDQGITFTVADTGPGIPPELLPVIFEPFRQGTNSLTHRQGGVGLGLYIVRQLSTMLAGTVAVESEVGRGSAFKVWIPRGI